MTRHLASILLLATTLCASGALAEGKPLQVAAPSPPPSKSYLQVTRDVAAMVGDQHAQKLVRDKGLNIVNVMWEDTGRFQGSSVGPNISDVTIEVEVEGIGGSSRHLMPVIRYPNFSDRTGDVDIDHFYLRVGNQHSDGSKQLRTITLRQFLENPTAYMSLPQNGRIKGGGLLAGRDSKVLTSAQSAFLPVPQGGKATFHPVIFNYQSYAKNPAVLTLLVTRQGTSMTVVDNNRDTVDGAASWGQRLFFNDGGERAPLIAERLKDVKASGTTANGESASSLGKDANLLVMIQVPLKVKRRGRGFFGLGGAMADEMVAMEMAPAPAAAGAPMKKSARRRAESDVDVAVLGHGESVGPYTELDGLTIERDPRFPIRATVQFYQATSNGVVSAADVERMYAQIGKVYAKADYVGSLVVPEADVRRITAWKGAAAPRRAASFFDFDGLVERWQKYGGEGLDWYRNTFTW